MTKIVLAIMLFVLAGCAGMNPNPGERTADTNWEMGNYSKALEVAKAAAERGDPWAQLRMGIYYNSGYVKIGTLPIFTCTYPVSYRIIHLCQESPV